MANKEYPLTLVLRAVDKATGPITRLAAKLEKMNEPVKKLSKAWGTVVKESGFGKVAAGFAGVGNALKSLAVKFLAVAGLAGLAARAVIGFITEFDNLGDTATKLGLTVDGLAQLRYAAEVAGSSQEELDGSMGKFNRSLGQLRANMGPLQSFLGKVSPKLRDQVKHAKSNEEAFLLMADAIAKVKDPAKRAALANAAFGKSAPIELLSKGREGIEELKKEFLEHAGSQEEAAEAAGKVDRSFKKVGASVQGVKAALVTALAPAILEISEKMTAWFAANKEQITQWFRDFGEKLPGIIDRVVDAFGEIFAIGKDIVDFFGGAGNAAIAFAAILVGPLLSSFVTLGFAMLTNPFGQVLAAIGLLITAGALLIKNWEDIKAAWEEVRGIFQLGSKRGGMEAVEIAKTKGVPAVQKLLANRGKVGAVEASEQMSRPEQTASVSVSFANAPKGMRANVEPESTAEVDLSTGFAMEMP